MSLNKILPLLFLLVLGMGLALDSYLPVLPKIKEYFHASQGEAQLTMSFFMLAYGAGQLFLGPISDIYGRKKIAILSLCLYLVSSLLCSLANHIHFIIFGRILQGLGASGSTVVAFATVRDIYGEKRSAPVYSYLNGIMSFSPMLAPLLGSLLNLLFGFRSIFLFLGFYALFSILCISIKFKESLTEKKRLTVTKKILVNYYEIAKNSRFQYYTLSGACGIATLFSYFSASPIFMIHYRGISESFYGILFGLNAIACLFSNIFAAKCILKVGILRSILVGASLILIGGLSMLLWGNLSPSIWSCFFPMLIASSGVSFILGSSASGALQEFERAAGTASAIYGSFSFIFSGIFGYYLIKLKLYTPSKLGLTLIVITCLLCLFRILYVKRLQ